MYHKKPGLMLQVIMEIGGLRKEESRDFKKERQC